MTVLGKVETSRALLKPLRMERILSLAKEDVLAEIATFKS